MAGWLIADTWQGPRYSPVKYTISDLQAATAPHAWFPIACFAAGGLGTFGFAVFGLRPALAGAGKAAWYAPWMLACSALALGNSFPLIPCRLADPGCTAHHQLVSPGGLTDAIVASIAFLVLALTPFPLWWRLQVLPQWRHLKPVMMAARASSPGLFPPAGDFIERGLRGRAHRADPGYQLRAVDKRAGHHIDHFFPPYAGPRRKPDRLDHSHKQPDRSSRQAPHPGSPVFTTRSEQGDLHVRRHPSTEHRNRKESAICIELNRVDMNRRARS